MIRTPSVHLSTMSPPMSRLYERPKLLVLLLVGSVFIAEIGVMLLLAHYFSHPVGWEAIVDSVTLVVILSPIFYYFYFRPLKHYLTAIKTSERQNKLLSRRLISSTEAQQKKMARDLHDEFGHALTSLVFGIESLRASLPVDATGPAQTCGELIKDVQDLTSRVRAYSSDLHPVGLDKLGIEDALQGFIQKQQCLHPGLMFEFETHGLKKRLDLGIETVLYRICQEGLTNVLKHSRADRVVMRLIHSHPQVILTLQDNGTGFDMSQLDSDSWVEKQGIGLLGMKERVAMVGGTFSVVSQLGQGTKLRVELPAVLAQEATG